MLNTKVQLLKVKELGKNFLKGEVLEFAGASSFAGVISVMSASFFYVLDWISKLHTGS